MNVDSALLLIHQIIYRPGWTITAEDHTQRYEGAIKLRVDYPAQSTNREEVQEAEGEYTHDIMTYACFTVIVADCPDETALYRRILEDCLFKIDHHEGREYFRVQPTFWAPFHPHRVDGMKRWGEPDKDIVFGIG